MVEAESEPPARPAAAEEHPDVRAPAAGARGGPGRRWAWPMPEVLRGAVLTVSPQAVTGLVLVAALAVGLAGSYLWRSRASAVPVDAPARTVPATVAGAGGAAPSVPVPAAPGTASSNTAPPGRPAAPAGSESGPTAAGTIPPSVVVDVAGSVRHPGVVTLPAGSRVADAVRAAGGVRSGADTATVNLARPLVDGEQVVIGGRGAVPPAGAPATVTGGPTGTVGPTGVAGSPGNGGPGVAGTSPGPGTVLDLNAATQEQFEELPGVGPVLAQRIVEWRTSHGRFSSVDELREVSGIGERKFADISARVRV